MSICSKNNMDSQCVGTPWLVQQDAKESVEVSVSGLVNKQDHPQDRMHRNR